MKKKLLTLLLGVSFLLTSCVRSYTYSESSTPEKTSASLSITEKPIESSEPVSDIPVSEPDKSVNFVAVGDNLIHSNIYNQASNRANGNGYDFSYVYKEVESYIKEADLAFINQETVVNSLYKPSGYPRFSTPTQMGDYLDKLGFDIVSVLNNHTLDVNSDGLLNSLEYWKTKKNLTVFGAYENQADYDNIRICEKNGIKFAFVAVTEHTNGLRLPKDSQIKFLYLKKDDSENDKLIKERIEKAKKLADVVVVSAHYGTEVSDILSDIQKEYSQKFSDWGADVILGTQPHTIQPIEILEADDGRQTLVFYCLGNFMGSMTVTANLSTLGMIGEFTVTKSGETGKLSFSKIGGLPLINHYDNNFANARIIMYKNYTKELANAHGANKYARITKENIDKQVNKILGNYIDIR